jgi:hypothetical protein
VRSGTIRAAAVLSAWSPHAPYSKFTKPRLRFLQRRTRPFVVIPRAGSMWNAVIDQNHRTSAGTYLCS